MSLADMTARSSPAPQDECPDCDTSASVTSDLHKYQVACTCKPGSLQYACADDPGPPAPAKTDTPPALPPRPPNNLLPHRRNNAAVPVSTDTNQRTGVPTNGNRHRYAWWCVGLGALAAALGGLLAAQHILLRAYTASPHHLETVPAAVPAAMLVLTGICIMSLARRRNRYSYMIKVVGACCLVCALTCVLVTITTTVIHMNKLQTLKFCEYTMLTRTCTCYSMPPDLPPTSNDEGVRCVFEGVSGCGAVHGALYWCLRAAFALSVAAGLVCIFSSMLAYQLLSHERKKMYWEQLELRCRSLYRPPQAQNTNTIGRNPQSTCSCCQQCHPAQPSWDISLQHRFWAPGRIGNLYSPNPGTMRKTSAWSWFPWPRSNSQNSRSCRLSGIPQSGDSAYGFLDSDNPQPNPNSNQNHAYEERYHPNFNRTQGNFATRSATHFPAQNLSQVGLSQVGLSQVELSQVGLSQVGLSQNVVFAESSGSYDAQTGVWGPPPPYSPQGRSNSRHHLHQDPASATLLHHHHIDHRTSMHHDQPLPSTQHACRSSQYFTHMSNMTDLGISPDARIMPPTDLVRMNPELIRLNPELVRLNPDIVRLNQDFARLGHVYPSNVKELARLREELARLGSESRFNTLRGQLVSYPTCQRGLGVSMGSLHRDCRMADGDDEVECSHQKGNKGKNEKHMDTLKKQGKENMAFQNEKHQPRRSGHDCLRNAESEVYFADVSSCCNVSLKAECCMQPNMSALVGTIENHAESTSESETGSFTLTRQQKPQPQTLSSKRRPRQSSDKHVINKNHEKLRQELNNSIRMAEHQIEQLSHSMCQRLNESRLGEHLRLASLNDSRLPDSLEARINDSVRMNERLNSSIRSEMSHESRNDSRSSEARMNESMRLNESRDSRGNTSFNERMSIRMEDRRNSDQTRLETETASPKNKNLSPLHLVKASPKSLSKRTSPSHLKQSSSDSNTSAKSPDFLAQTTALSPLTPNTEESLLSDEEERQNSFRELEINTQELPKNECKDAKVNHLHCYSDTNTMDSGWQSGSEKHIND